MKFGVREICDVVLKAKATQKVGNKKFYKHEPVIYFDTLKTSTLEGAATTVYAQGGAGNPRLIAWEGERTITFTMEDALISPEGFMILSGAGLIDATENTPIYQHATENTANIKAAEDKDEVVVYVSEKPAFKNADEDYAYIMVMEGEDLTTEPFIADMTNITFAKVVNGTITATTEEAGDATLYGLTIKTGTVNGREYTAKDLTKLAAAKVVMVDFYVKRTGNAKQIEITADKFGGNYYLEASTLFRNTDGVDMPAEFIIPNCKIQSNFTFTMASSGDPSTFTFTMDAFPDYTRFDPTKKVLSAIQIIEDTDAEDDIIRKATNAQ